MNRVGSGGKVLLQRPLSCPDDAKDTELRLDEMFVQCCVYLKHFFHFDYDCLVACCVSSWLFTL